ncbi:MAG: Crp/Fnr family transcriptional regulator [Spirochaetaceae bacterium]|nr:Crp/Fnr family transcriptional regulator [Spirochaetaceae bacterium]
MNTTEFLTHPLFIDLDEQTLPEALKLFCSAEKTLKKGEMIFHSRTTTEVMGFVLDGRIQIESTDYWGNKTIIDNLGTGKVFGETYALTGKPLMVDAVAVEDSKIMLLNPKNIFVHSDNKINSILIKNILRISMNKNLHLSQRIFHTNSKTIRGRLLAYLSSCVPSKTPNTEFDIPYDRQQLADYLQVDRSALSTELSKMKADGLIDFWKNHFKLLHRD